MPISTGKKKAVFIAVILAGFNPPIHKKWETKPARLLPIAHI